MRRVGIPELGRMEAHLKELQAENAQLQAVVDAAKVVVKERGIHRYHKPMDVAIDAMLDAIKEVVK